MGDTEPGYTKFLVAEDTARFQQSVAILSGEQLRSYLLDAFAPDKQPEMWTRQVFDRLYAVSAEGGVLTTYCAKGSVRRMLADAGFVVERLPGPPGKREMLRAVRQ